MKTPTESRLFCLRSLGRRTRRQGRGAVGLQAAGGDELRKRNLRHSQRGQHRQEKDVDEYFKVDVRPVVFHRDGSGVAEGINEWVRAKTTEKISELLDGHLRAREHPGVPHQCHLYFKGAWLTAFEVNETKPFSFYNHGQDDVEVAAMTLHQRLGYATVGELGARAVEVPYAGGRFRMTIVFTNSETGLSAVKSGLKASLVES
ncbi:hypothetical protein HPB49_013111 [Dermacentor silvarum]|uniref:Uncharacterized protein n=1 Tax=Dermacentor silvarum TaxID=543639 RepID=A0ACB8DIH7_DERSI|nr:hypothetical protein HPB49_013111 [Dermacentor silvarum]